MFDKRVRTLLSKVKKEAVHLLDGPKLTKRLHAGLAGHELMKTWVRAKGSASKR